jgi:prolyl-tRNA editing enzyme YbaK/EbsC (Cys-tRNA(Pro) deacylase)
MTDGEEIEQRVIRVLEALRVPYELMRIDPAFADTAACCARYGLPLESAANTIIVASRKAPRQHSACVVQATSRLDVNHALRKLAGGARLSFASAEESVRLTGMMLGGVTVFALPPAVPIYVDAAVMERPWVVLGSGSRSSKIKVSPDVFTRLASASIVPGLAIPLDAPRPG